MWMEVLQSKIHFVLCNFSLGRCWNFASEFHIFISKFVYFFFLSCFNICSLFCTMSVVVVYNIHGD